MVVYIEEAILENFILDGTLLYLALKTISLPIKKLRLFFSALIGTAFAIVFPLFSCLNWIKIVLRYSFGILLCFLTTDSFSIKKCVFLSFVFYAYTFLVGGMILAVYSFFNLQYTDSGGYLIGSAPIGVVFAFTLLFCVIGVFAIKNLWRKKRIKKYTYSCKLTLNKEISCNGYWDTGNKLYYKGIPVCMASLQFLKKLYAEENISQDYIVNHCEKMKISTVTGEKYVFILPIQKLKIYCDGKTNIIDMIRLGIGTTAQFDGYDLLLHRDCMEECYEQNHCMDSKNMEKN